MFNLMMILHSYHRNLCKNNNFPTVVVDDLSPQQKEASKSMMKKSIHTIG